MESCPEDIRSLLGNIYSRLFRGTAFQVMVVGVCFLVPVRLDCIVVYLMRYAHDHVVGYFCGGRFDRELPGSRPRPVHDWLDTRLQDCASCHRHYRWIIREWIAGVFVWIKENWRALRLLEQIMRYPFGHSPTTYIYIYL